MDSYKFIIKMLNNNEHFCFVRFNDGEMMGIEKVGARVARKDQVVNQELQSKLIEAIQHRQHNYWIGKPCGKCFPKHKETFDTFVNPDYRYLTHAVILCNNGHWKPFVNEYVEALENKYVYWISGNDQNIDLVKENFNPKFHVEEHFKVPRKNGWSAYHDIKDMYVDLKPNSIVNLSCGPMSRVLAYEWFKERPDCTFIDIGSVFDPFTRNVWHKCHKGKLTYCAECNFLDKESK
jgi:hypothetical protein